MSPPKGVLAATMLVTVTGCGSGERSDTVDRFAAIPKRTIQAPDDLTAPRWQQIAVLRNDANASKRITVSRAALQWRVRWRCDSGRLTITVTPAPASSDGRTAGHCPGHAIAIWVGAGTRTVAVHGADGVRAVVEEELRTPLREPAPLALRSGQARELAHGQFRPIESKAGGSAIIYRLPDGRLALRLQRFLTEPNPDLDVWLSEAKDPTTSREIFRAKHRTVRSLKATLGDQNYPLRASTDAARIHSIVVVNARQRIAYAAAKLTP